MAALSCAEDGAHALELTYVCAATGIPEESAPLGVFTPGNWALLEGAEVLGDPSCVALDTTRSPGQVLCIVQTIDSTGESIVLP